MSILMVPKGYNMMENNTQKDAMCTDLNPNPDVSCLGTRRLPARVNTYMCCTCKFPVHDMSHAEIAIYVKALSLLVDHTATPLT